MEQKILFLINREWTSPALDLFMAAMSNFDIWRVPLVLAAVALFAASAFSVRVMLILGLSIVAISDGLIVNGLKTLVNRPRPPEVVPGIRIVDLRDKKPRLLALFAPAKVKLSRPSTAPGRGRSFPSGHTTNNFSIGTVLTVFHRRWGWLYFIPAALVGYSRIYVGSHWPTDVLTSIFLAIGTTLFFLCGAEWLWKKHGQRLFPMRRSRQASLFGGAAG